MGSSNAQENVARGIQNSQTGLTGTNQNLMSMYAPAYNNYQNASAIAQPNYQAILGGYQDFLAGRNPGMGRPPGINAPLQQQSSTPYGPPAGMLVSPGQNIYPQGPNTYAPGGAGGAPTTNTALTGGNLGGGWQQFSQQGSPQDALAQGLQKGLKGQQLVDQVNQQLGLQPPNSIAYNPQDGTYGLPNGFYAAPNPQNPQALDLIQRSGGGGGGGQGSAIGGWQNMALTGGFSPQARQDILAQAEAPARAIYQNAQNDLATQQARTGGYMPNAAAAQGNLARGATQAISANDIAANAALAQLVQQGQLAGLGGLTGAQLGALGGLTGAYGASPGLLGLTGNQALGVTGQQLQGNALQNQIMQGTLGYAQVPNAFQTGLGTAGQFLGMLPGLGGILGGFGGGSGGPSLGAGDFARAGTFPAYG
jgi:hypothetical protein